MNFWYFLMGILAFWDTSYVLGGDYLSGSFDLLAIIVGPWSSVWEVHHDGGNHLDV